jgi:hypothetical protein
MDIFTAFFVLIACNLVVIGTSLYAYARVGTAFKAIKDLDWEAIAALTGDVATLKRGVQKVNNRLNGMEVHDPIQTLQSLPQLQQNVTPLERKGG